MHASHSERSPVKLSLVIPVRNEKGFIDRLLGSIVSNPESEKGWLEVLLVDDASSDGSGELIEEWSETYPFIRLLRLGRHAGPAAARNLGVRISRSDFVACVDADGLVDKDWLSNAILSLSWFERADVGAVGGAILPSFDPASRFQCVMAEFPLHKVRKNSDSEIIDLPTGNVLLRKSALLSIGLFDETLSFGEDTDLCGRLRAAGFSLSYNRELRVYHQVPSTWLAMVASQFRYGLSFASYLRRTDGFSWDPLRGHHFFESLIWYFSLLLFALVAMFYPEIWWFVFLPAYGVTAVFSMRFGRKDDKGGRVSKLAKKVMVVVIHQGMHFSYQLGYFWGGVRLGR